MNRAWLFWGFFAFVTWRAVLYYCSLFFSIYILLLWRWRQNHPNKYMVHYIFRPSAVPRLEYTLLHLPLISMTDSLIVPRRVPPTGSRGLIFASIRCFSYFPFVTSYLCRLYEVFPPVREHCYWWILRRECKRKPYPPQKQQQPPALHLFPSWPRLIFLTQTWMYVGSVCCVIFFICKKYTCIYIYIWLEDYVAAINIIIDVSGI